LDNNFQRTSDTISSTAPPGMSPVNGLNIILIAFVKIQAPQTNEGIFFSTQLAQKKEILVFSFVLKDWI
jgi:hypothetical protein